MKNFCFVVGNSRVELSDEGIYPDIVKAIEKHVTEYGVTEFLIGNIDNFDKMAQNASLEVKQRHPEIRLTRLLHFRNRPADRVLPEGFDGTLYLKNMKALAKRNCTQLMNIQILLKADYLIIHSPRSYGREWSFLNVARACEENGWLRMEQLV